MGEFDVCPIAPEISYSKVGNIWDSNSIDLKDNLPISEPVSVMLNGFVVVDACLLIKQCFGEALYFIEYAKQLVI
jgi:hypothetical protein